MICWELRPLMLGLSHSMSTNAHSKSYRVGKIALIGANYETLLFYFLLIDLGYALEKFVASLFLMSF